ncbi:glutamine amidotransferase [Aquabacter sediminis]|uniref:glutamine amidotransferase n=1 Tax=Aquabacter sediminis TaxID=3029197 RepID=UPI003CCFF363
MDRRSSDEGWSSGIDPAPATRRERILIILHQAHSTPGRIGLRLEQRGYELDVRRPALGDDLPANMDGHSGAVVFGGPMSANDAHPWIRREIDFVGMVMGEDKPLLGVCLGAQLMAVQLGARVARHGEGLSEIGYYPVRPTKATEGVLPWPTHVYHWHSEGFDLPSGAELLACGDVFPNQAFRHGRCAYGIQFHPEVTHEMMCRWTTRGAEKLGLPGAQPGEAHLEGWSRYDPAICRWLTRFLDMWLAPQSETSPTALHSAGA